MSTQAMSELIAQYFKTQPVLKAWLFGSFSRGEETPESDVDILVRYDENAKISLLTISHMMGVLEKVLYLTCLALIGVGPLVLGLATYLPGVLGWSYLGISAFPLAYVVGDALSMSKEYGNISEGDEF